jgi:hypothetical protein
VLTRLLPRVPNDDRFRPYLDALALATRPPAAGAVHIGTVTIDATHLPALFQELLDDLEISADGLRVRPYDAASPYNVPDLDEIAVDAGRARSLIDVLDQIGWQVTQDATITAPVDLLRFIFGRVVEDITTDVLPRLTATPPDWRPDGALPYYQQALAGAEQVLAQLEAAGVARAMADA